MRLSGFRSNSPRNTALGLALLSLLPYCSGLKLDKGINCLNENSGCFKPDSTRPQFLKSILPADNAVVSTLGEVQLLFSEELNNPQPSDFAFTEPGLTVQSVSKIDKYTYKLLTNRNPTQGGPLTLSFPNLRDYAGNIVTNGSVSYTINLNVPVDTTADRNGVSPNGYPTISVTWHYSYVPVQSGNTVYHVRLTTGAEDCNAGSPITPISPVPAVNTPVQTYDTTNAGTIAATTYSFSVDTSVIIASGAQKILVCVDNAVNNKHGTGIVNIVRDDDAPFLSSLTISPVEGNYVAPQTLTFNCDDNVDKIVYDYASNVFSGADPLASAITPEPNFNTSTGAVTSGYLYDPNNKPQTPYSGNTTRTIYKYRCIDKAGNMTPATGDPAKISEVYRINSTFPSVNFVNLTRTGSVANPPVAIEGIGAGGFTSAVLQWNTNQSGQNYEIRYDSNACGSGAPYVTNGTTPGTANPTMLTTLTPASTGITAEALYNIRICVTNGTDWAQASLSLVRDDSAPAMPTVNIPPASYGSEQYLVFSCSDNAARIAYTESYATPTGTPTDPGDPQFDADGKVFFGAEHTGPLRIKTDDTALVGKKTRVKWRCMDKAGHTSTVNDGTYLIDTVLPNVTVQSQDRTAISNQVGAYNAAQITWVSDRSAAGYEIRRNSTNCTDGVVLASGTNLSNVSALAANTPITSTINANAANFPGGENDYTIHICVTNNAGGRGYTTRSVRYDTTGPLIPVPGPTITAVDTTNFTLSWTAATDTGGSGVAGYRIFRSLTSGFYSATPDYTATSSPATIAMPDTQPYYIRIVPFDAAGNVPTVAPLVYTEAATKPSITLVVSGFGGNFDLTDGTASQTITGNTVGSPWTTSLTVGQAYKFSVTTQPAGRICVITENPFGNLATNLTIHVVCNAGQWVGGNFQSTAPVPLNYLLYRGKVTTLAGNGAAGFADNTTGTSAQFQNPEFLVYFNNALYVADSNNRRVRRVNLAAPYAVTTVAGSATAAAGDASDDGPCLTAKFGVMTAIATDGVNFYTGEYSPARRIRKISDFGGTCTVTTLAGTGAYGYVNGPAASAQFSDIYSIVSDGANLYVSENGNNRIRKIDLATGIVSTIAGNGVAASVDASTGTSASFNSPTGATIIGTDLYLGDVCWTCSGNNGNTIRKISLIAPHAVTTVAGVGGTSGLVDGPGSTAKFYTPIALTTDGTYLFVADLNNSVIRRIDPNNGYRVSTLAGTGALGHADGTGPAAVINRSHGVATDGRTIYFGEWGGHRIKKLSDAGLVGYWAINPGVNPNDYSSDNTVSLNGSVVGGPLSTLTDRFGNANKASLFNGTSQQITAATTGLPTGNAPRTMCAWVKPTAAPTGAHVIATYGGTGTNQSFGLYLSYFSGAQHVGLTAYGGLPDDLLVPHIISTTEWTHLCAWANGTTGKLYLNGKTFGSYAHTFATTSTAMRIGAQQGNIQYFGGGIADVRIYDRALSEGEINELAQNAAAAQVGQTFSTGGTGLVAHYTLANSVQAQGPVGGSLSGAGSVASLINGKDGATNGAFYYDGGGYHYTNSNVGLPIGNAPRTHCGWVRPANRIATGQYFTILQYGLNGTNQKSGLWLRDNGGVKKLVNGGGGNDHEADFDFPINTWIHVCNTYDGNNSSLYANGRLLGTASFPAWNTQSGSLGIGRDLPTAGFLTGGLADIRIYNNALNATQIRELATQVPEGLVFRLDMNGDFNDVSGFGHAAASNPGSLAAGRRGIANTAYRFIAPQQAQFPHSNELLQQANISWSFWMKSPDMSTLSGQVMGKYVNSPESGWVIKYDQSNYAHGWTAGTAGNGAYSNSHPVPTNNVWNHYAYVRSGSGLTVYMNGISISNTVFGNGSNIVPNSVNLTVGFNGIAGDVTLQDMRIYNRGLSTGEVQALAGYHAVQAATGLRLHVQADTFSNLSDGNGISTNWTNSVIQTPVAGSGTVGGTPRFVSGTNSLLGGMPAVEFDGTAGKYFDFGFPNYTYSGVTVCAAATRKSNGYRGLIEKRGSTATTNSWGMLNDFPTDALKFEMDSTGSSEVVTAITTDTPAIFCAISGAGNLLSSYLNGASSTSVSKAIMSGLNSDRLVVGARFDLASSYYGQIGDVFVMTKDASAAERRIAECYLSAKYSIPLTGSAVCP